MEKIIPKIGISQKKINLTWSDLYLGTKTGNVNDIIIYRCSVISKTEINWSVDNISVDEPFAWAFIPQFDFFKK